MGWYCHVKGDIAIQGGIAVLVPSEGQGMAMLEDGVKRRGTHRQ
jgi:hypothetical protein